MERCGWCLDGSYAVRTELDNDVEKAGNMQACGNINDHAHKRFKYERLLKEGNIKYIYE